MDQSDEEEIDEEDGEHDEESDGKTASDEENDEEYSHDGKTATENGLIDKHEVELVIEELLCVRVGSFQSV